MYISNFFEEAAIGPKGRHEKVSKEGTWVHFTINSKPTLDILRFVLKGKKGLEHNLRKL